MGVLRFCALGGVVVSPSLCIPKLALMHTVAGLKRVVALFFNGAALAVTHVCLRSNPALKPTLRVGVRSALKVHGPQGGLALR